MAETHSAHQKPVTIFGPDFPFPFDDWIKHPAGIGAIPAEKHGAEVAVIGAGISGLVSAYELMKLGLKPVVYEASQLGGRLRSQPFEGRRPASSPSWAACAFRFPRLPSIIMSTGWGLSPGPFPTRSPMPPAAR